MPNINKEARIVDWLLQRYGLLDKRCRFMLRDLNHQFEDDLPIDIGSYAPAPGRLTLTAFDLFFRRAFPIRLHISGSRGKPASAITARDVFTRFNRTRLVREFDSLSSAEFDGRAPALLCPWSYTRDIGQTLVVHNRLSIDAELAGPHLLYRFTDGSVLILETLDVLLTTIDSKVSPTDWMASAMRSGFDTPVESNHGPP